MATEVPVNSRVIAPERKKRGGAPQFAGEWHGAVDGSDETFSKMTLSVTVAGTNTVLVAGFHAEFGETSWAWQATYNGVKGRLYVETDGYAGGAGNRLFRIYYWIAPTAGTHDLVVENLVPPGANELAAVALLFTGVAQTLCPFRTAGKDISASDRDAESVTIDSAVNDLVLHFMASSRAPADEGALGAGEDEIANANDGDADASLKVSTKAGAASVTVSSTGWGDTFPLQGVALSLMPAATPETLLPFIDQFDRGDETPLSNGGKWDNTLSPAGVVDVVSAVAKGNTATENLARVASAAYVYSADHRASVKYVSGNGQFVRVGVRVQADGSGYYLSTSGAGDLSLLKITQSLGAYSYDTKASTTMQQASVDDDLYELQVTTSGGNAVLRAFWKGQRLPALDYTDSTAVITGGQPGLGSFFAQTISRYFESSNAWIRF